MTPVTSNVATFDGTTPEPPNEGAGTHFKYAVLVRTAYPLRINARRQTQQTDIQPSDNQERKCGGRYADRDTSKFGYPPN